MLPVFCHCMKRNPAKNFDCNRGIYIYFISFDVRKQCSVSKVMEIKTDITKQIKMTSRSPCSDLLQNNSLQFFIASKGKLC